MDLTATPMEAFKHFLLNWKGTIPKDVQEARYAMEGKRKHGLGEKRIRNLLEKYGAGRYEFRDVVIIHEKED